MSSPSRSAHDDSHPASDEEPSISDTTPPTPIGADAGGVAPRRTLLWTAATARPLAEVAALVGLLKRDSRLRGRRAEDGDEALRAAAVARPVGDVRQLVALLNESPQNAAEADTTLRAAAVGRPIEDVAELAGILDAPDDAPAAAVEDPAAPAPATAPTAPAPAPTTALVLASSPAARAGGGQARRAVPAVRWVAVALLVLLGLAQLPADAEGLRAGDYTDGVAPALGVLCLAAAVALAVADAVWTWAAGAAVATAVLLLHVLTAVLGGADVLRHSVGNAIAGSGATQAALTVLAVAVLALAAGALLRRPHPATRTRST